jgi:3-deoxy-D-manno-octulosonate 8-phosphate phosphatase (KDO 8-P phosphatase)
MSPDFANLKLLLFDVDGVLTDGSILLHADGSESKQFNIRDGAAMVWARRAGLTIGLLSARAADATAVRAVQLGIEIVVQGGGNKLLGYEQILRDTQLRDAQVGYMGDDLQDLPVLRRAGFAAAPADAAQEVREAVHWVSAARGGRGAVRECIEHVLRARDAWRTAVADYLES